MEAVTTVKTRRSGDEIRALILGAARDEFAAGGFQGTTTRRIAAAADVSERLIYLHFESKTGLFEAAVVEPFDAFMEDFADRWRRAASEPQSFEELARSWVGGMYDLLREHRRLVLALLMRAAYDEDAADPGGGDSPFARLHALTEDIMRAELAARGLTHPDLPLSVRLPFAAVLAAAVFDRPVLAGTGRRPGRDRIVDELTALVVHGTAGRGPAETRY